MSDLNQMYVSFLIEQKLRNNDIPASNFVSEFASTRHLVTTQPSLLRTVLGSIHLPPTRRRHAISMTAISQAKGTGGAC